MQQQVLFKNLAQFMKTLEVQEQLLLARFQEEVVSFVVQVIVDFMDSLLAFGFELSAISIYILFSVNTHFTIFRS